MKNLPYLIYLLIALGIIIDLSNESPVELFVGCVLFIISTASIIILLVRENSKSSLNKKQCQKN